MIYRVAHWVPTVPANINQSLQPIQGLTRNRTTSLQIVESRVRTDIAIATLISSLPLLGHGSVFIVAVIVETFDSTSTSHTKCEARVDRRRKKRV
jgi:hypothetical protein